MAPLRYIFFDVGNTLLFPNRSQILAPLLKHCPEPTLEQWHAIERETKPAFDRALEANPRVDHGFWWLFYTRLLDSVNVSHNGVRDSLLETTQQSANWDQIRPGTREALERLRKSYRIAVISNADGKIAEVL